MKFQNITNKTLMFKINNEWVNINPNEIVELNGRIDVYDKRLKLVDKIKTVEVNQVLKPKEENKKSDKPKKMFKTFSQLKQMTKDELNDYGAIIGLKEIKASDKKENMIKKIMEFQKNESK